MQKFTSHAGDHTDALAVNTGNGMAFVSLTNATHFNLNAIGGAGEFVAAGRAARATRVRPTSPA